MPYGSSTYGSSTYEAGLVVPQFKVELGLSSPSTSFTLDSATKGILDTSTLGDEFGYVWTDVSQWVDFGSAPLSFARGSSRSQGPFWRYEGGRAAFTLENLDGRFDPLNASGPYASGAGLPLSLPGLLGGSDAASDLRPSIPVRVTLTLDGTTETLWSGKVDSWDVDYSSATWSTASVTCNDGVEFLQRADRPELPFAVGGGESAAARIGRILDLAGWPTGERDIQSYVGGNTMQASTLAQSAWTEILLTSDSDAGYVWIDRAGRFVFRPRGGLSPSPVLTFSSTAGSTDLEFDDITISYDKQQVYNVVRLSRAGGTQQFVEDLSSQALIREVRGYERNDLICETDFQVMEIATWLLGQTAPLRMRVDGIRLRVPMDASAFGTARWWQLARLDIGQTIRVVHATPDGRSVVRDGVVRSLDWTIGVLDAVMTIGLQAAPATYVPFTLDSGSMGILDSSTLAVPAVV